MRDFDFVERDTDAYYQAMTDGEDTRRVRCCDCIHYGLRMFGMGMNMYMGICLATDEPIAEPDRPYRWEDLDCYEDRF